MHCVAREWDNFFSLDFIKLVFASLSYSNFSEYLQQYSCDIVCVLLPTFNAMIHKHETNVQMKFRIRKYHCWNCGRKTSDVLGSFESTQILQPEILEIQQKRVSSCVCYSSILLFFCDVGKKERTKAPKIQRLVTPLTLQRKRHKIALKKRRAAKKRDEAAEYAKLLAQRLKEAKERKLERRRSASQSKSSVSRDSTSASAAKPPAAQTTAKAAKPSAKQAKAVVKMAKAASKTAKPAPKAAKPAKPAAKTTKPAGKAAKPSKPTGKAGKSSGKK